MALHTINDPPVFSLDAQSAFDALQSNEREYVYACSQASWVGGLIDLIQLSPESAGIFLLMHRTFSIESADSLAKVALSNGFTEEEVSRIYSYLALVYGNLGNYLSFGDTKFIPPITMDKLKRFFQLSEAFQQSEKELNSLFDEISASIYSLEPRRLALGFGPEGISTYYSADCTRQEAELVQKYLEFSNTEPDNTRIFKDPPLADNMKQVLNLRFASSKRATVDIDSAFPVPEGYEIRLQFGDYAELMEVLVESIEECVKRSLNPKEANMWRCYSESFSQGDTKKHKEGSILWVSDKDPIVESYIGFIENYRDPLGVRAEFEGFVAVVNKELSRTFANLVDHAPDLLSLLPWPKTYEVDTFKRPDFTSLDVVTFACSGIPIGINIPNYYDIREKNGFKNVSLGNVIAARFKDPKADFISESDRQLYIAKVQAALELQVGLHELLGHGSGKLFCRNADGSFNFDPSKTLDLITGKPVTNWYEPGETWSSKFANFSSAMEECRAECVGVYLCDVEAVLKVFNMADSQCDPNGVSDVTYINWLSMVQSGVKSLEFYSPAANEGDTGSWRQAHCCARYTILNVLIQADPSLVRLEEVPGSDGAPDIVIHLDREKLLTVAKPAVGKFLEMLQYYKSTGLASDGCAWFTGYSEPSGEHLRLRSIVLDRKRPRPVYVQPGFRRAGDRLELVQYEASYAGLIQSFADRFNQFPLGPRAIKALEAVWRRDWPYFQSVPL